MSLFEELIEDRQEDEKIVKSFKTKDSLSPEIFKRDGESFVMHDDVRKQLLKICDNFLDTLGVEFFVHDIILTGSLANYNWSSYSDVDLHILLDMDEFGTEDKNQIILKNIFKEFFDTKKDYWNHKHDVKIKGFDVELYVQDLKEPHISSGVYSIVQNKWIIEPKRETPNIDDNKIIDKAEEIQKKIDNLLKKSNDSNIVNQIDELRDKIRKFRQCGLEKGGEYSYENLVFKLLRRNGYIDKIIKFKHHVTDKELSLNETPDEIRADGYEQVKYNNKDGFPFGIYDGILMLGYNASYIPDEIYEKIKEKYLSGYGTGILGKSARGVLYKFKEFVPYSTHPEIPIFYQVLYELGIEKTPVDFESYKKDFWRTMFKFAGRFWIVSKVLSFWEYPETKEDLISVLKDVKIKMKKIYNIDVDFNEYKIEVKSEDENGKVTYKMLPINEYIGKYLTYSKDELEAPHLLPPEEKSKHPQMQAVKKANIEKTGELEKVWNSLARRNYILNKNIAENNSKK